MGDCNCTGSQAASTSNADKKFLMVEATSSEAANCPQGAAQAIATEQCIKEDKTYDRILSDIGMPAIGTSVEVLVCDGSLYRVNQYIRFVDSGASLKIIAISTNRLQLYNGGCDGTNPLPGNPDPGTVIDRNSYFYVIDEPYCQSLEELREEIDSALQLLEEVCVPNLLDADTNDKQRPVGFATENLINTSFKKCMRKVLGWFWKGGHAYYENPDVLVEANASSYRALYRNKTTGKIEERATTSEIVGTNNKYIRLVGGAADVLLPGALILIPNATVRTLKETGPNTEVASATITLSGPGSYSEVFTLNYPEVSDNLQYMFEDYFYALVHVTMGVQSNGFGLTCIANLKMNSQDALVVGSNQYMFNSVMMPIKIDKAAKTLTVLVDANTGDHGKMYLKIQLLGIYI